MLHNHEDWSLDPITHGIIQAFWEYLTPEKMAVRRKMITGLCWLPASQGNSSKVQGETLFLENDKGYIVFSFGLCIYKQALYLHIHVHTCSPYMCITQMSAPKVKKINKLVYFLKESLRRDTACFVSLMQIISEMSSKRANDSNRLYQFLCYFFQHA